MEDLQVLRDELYTRIDKLLFDAIGQHVSEIHKQDLDNLDYEQLVVTYDAICELQELSIREKAIHKFLDGISLQNKM